MNENAVHERYTEKETGQKADVLFNKSGALTPFLISLITGLFVFVLMILTFEKLRLASILGVIAAGFVWAPFVFHWFKITKVSFMPTVETITDTAGDQQERQAAGEPLLIKFSMPTVKDGGYKVERYEWPIRPSQMQALAERTLAGEEFAEAKFLKGKGKIFTPKEFFGLRDYLKDRGLLLPKDPGRSNGGFAWSEDALELMRRIIKEDVLA